MTEKLFTGTLNHNQNKKKKKNILSLLCLMLPNFRLLQFLYDCNSVYVFFFVLFEPMYFFMLVLQFSDASFGIF